MRSLSETPKDWTLENDEELADLLKDIVNTDIPGLFGNIRYGMWFLVFL